jgi:hypothetical protein
MIPDGLRRRTEEGQKRNKEETDEEEGQNRDRSVNKK